MGLIKDHPVLEDIKEWDLESIGHHLDGEINIKYNKHSTNGHDM